MNAGVREGDFVMEAASQHSSAVTGRHAVFSIATNGYDRAFESCLRSQRDYCHRIGVPRFLVHGRPPWGIGAHDSAWLKATTMRHLLHRFPGGVLYLDADCEVMPDAPDFRQWDEREPRKSLFACLDFSDRLNAAVIYSRGAPEGRRLVRRLCWSAFVPSFFLPRSDRNLYENGHFIWLLKDSPAVHIMPQEWNAGLYRRPDRPYIIHHGGTTMRDAHGERPMALGARLHAAWVGFRLPFHAAWFRRCLRQPVD